jgi:hypothetical protein
VGGVDYSKEGKEMGARKGRSLAGGCLLGRAPALGLLLLVIASVFLWLGCKDTDSASLPAPVSLPLELKFDVPSEVEVGEDVPFRLSVTNVSDEELELGLGGLAEGGYRGSFGLFIEDARGQEVTCNLCANRPAPAILSPRTLQPGEALEFRWDWEQTDNDLKPVAAGTYTVYGIFSAFDVVRPDTKTAEMRTESREFTIRP